MSGTDETRAQLRRLVETQAAALREVTAQRDALRLVHEEARELIGELDAHGSIPAANIEALRALLWRATVRGAT